jgi:broad specificity phosphatase PhoE
MNQHFALQEFVTQKIGDDVESVAEVFQRATDFIRSRAAQHSGENVLMTAHGGVINSIMNHLEFKQGHRWRAGNCGWIEMEVLADGTIRILSKNGVVQTEELTVL